MSMYPYHMRRRPRRGMSERYWAEQDARDRALMIKLIATQIWRHGDDAARLIEAVVCQAYEERPEAEDEGDPDRCQGCREELAEYGSSTCGCSRSRSWGGSLSENWSGGEE